jgi:hypothetical protein
MGHQKGFLMMNCLRTWHEHASETAKFRRIFELLNGRHGKGVMRGVVHGRDCPLLPLSSWHSSRYVPDPICFIPWLLRLLLLLLPVLGVGVLQFNSV